MEFNLTTLTITAFVLINILTFIVYGIDKIKAKKKWSRISEATLLWMAVCGGSIGAYIGMKTWHHKTLHKKFKWGVPAIIIAQLALFVFGIYYFNL